MHVFIYTERLFTWNGEEHDTSRTRSTLSATIKLKEEGKTGNQRDQCVEDDEAFSERFVWQDAHKADQAQEEEFHAEESGATPTGSSARGESGQLDGHGPPGTEPDQRERAIALAEALSSEYPQRPPPAPRLPPRPFRYPSAEHTSVPHGARANVLDRAHWSHTGKAAPRAGTAPDAPDTDTGWSGRLPTRPAHPGCRSFDTRRVGSHSASWI